MILSNDVKTLYTKMIGDLNKIVEKLVNASSEVDVINTQYRNYFIKNYILTNCQKLKIIIIN